MHRRLALGFALCLLFGTPPASGEEEIEWYESLSAARRTARAERKPVLAVLVAPGERESERLLRDLDRNRSIRALLPNFVCVRLDFAKNAALARRYGLKYTPSTLFLTMLGTPLKLISGPVSAGKYLGQMKDALAKHARMWRPRRPERPAPKPPTPGDEEPEQKEEIPRLRHGAFCPKECPHCDPVVDRALAWLVRRQAGDGHWRKPVSERVTTNEDGQTVTRSIDHIDVALTSLAGLALISAGSTPSRGPHRAQVSRAVEFVSGAIRPDGIVSNKAGHDFLYLVHCNFETSLAAMFLAEAQKLDPDPELRAGLTRVARYLQDVQDPVTGAWGYSYDFRDHPAWTRRGWRLLATTQVAIVAVEACRDAGIPVRDEVLQRGARYLLACRGRDGAFVYRSEMAMQTGEPGSTAGALLALARSGLVPENLLDTIRARHRRHYREIDHFGEHWWWFLLFSALAMNDEAEGAIEEFDSTFRDVLLARQRDDGSFVDPDEKGGSVYATAIAATVLTLRRGNLPIAGARSREVRPIDVVRDPDYLRPPHDLSRVKVFTHGRAYRYDLLVSVDGEPGEDYLNALREGIVGANRTIYDVTDGQMTLNRAEIRTKRAGWEKADIRIGPEFRDAEVNPHPFAHGITRVSRQTRIVNGRETKGLRIGDFILFPLGEPGKPSPIRWDNPRFVHVLAHELGHYLLGALDEYDTGTGESWCDCLMGRRRWTELCTDSIHTDPRTEESCWAHAEALYPLLRVPEVPDPGPWDPPLPEVEIVR